LVVALLVAAAIWAELTSRLWSSATGCVEIVNDGDSSLEGLVVTYGNTKITKGRLGSGQSTKVWFTAAGRGLLSIQFQQKGNALKGFEVQDFDPADNARNAFRLVLTVKPNRVERYMDDDPWVSATSLPGRIKEWVNAELRSSR
jgi:hypothetical protein